MPLELHIIRASEFIRISAHGHFDLAASKAALAELVRACRKRGINQAMVDLRALRPNPKPIFSPADLAALVRTFPEAGFSRQQRVAILYHSDPHRRARLFAFLSTMHGWAVKAFADFETALLWLSEPRDLTPKSKRSPQGKRVPVRLVLQKGCGWGKAKAARTGCAAGIKEEQLGTESGHLDDLTKRFGPSNQIPN